MNYNYDPQSYEEFELGEFVRLEREKAEDEAESRVDDMICTGKYVDCVMLTEIGEARTWSFVLLSEREARDNSPGPKNA